MAVCSCFGNPNTVVRAHWMIHALNHFVLFFVFLLLLLFLLNDLILLSLLSSCHDSLCEDGLCVCVCVCVCLFIFWSACVFIHFLEC